MLHRTMQVIRWGEMCVWLLVLAPVRFAEAALPCECVALYKPSGYGARCASWDATDEDPWCVVRKDACGHDTFESDRGHYWSKAPCGGKGDTYASVKHIGFGMRTQARSGAADIGAGTVAFPNSTMFLQRMQYWEPRPPPILTTARASSALRGAATGPLYLSFEPDFGGFNNIRLQFEIVVLLARTLGRTLVMPPKQAFYLLPGGLHSLFDFFDEKSLRRELGPTGGLVTQQEFVRRESKRLRFSPSVKRKFATQRCGPYAWACENGAMRELAKTPKWNALERVLAFPTKPKALAYLKTALTAHLSVGEVTRVLNQQYGGAAGARMFTPAPELLQAPVIHLKMQHPAYRMFGHFAQFVAFGDVAGDHGANTFIRSALHFHDRLIEIASRAAAQVGPAAAAKIAAQTGPAAVTTHAAKRAARGSTAGYAALHVRRNDFQYKDMFSPAGEIARNIQRLVKPGTTLYISTDERRHEFFDALTERYTIVFLSDVLPLAGLTGSQRPPDYWLGQIEQLICTQADIFVGTRLSTFTAYIQRMRGYMGHGAAGGPSRIAHINTGLYYIQGRVRNQGPYTKLVHNGDEDGETAQSLQAAVAQGAPSWGRAYAQTWRKLARR